MLSKIVFGLFVFLLLSTNSVADDRRFASWDDLLQALKAENINTITIDWMNIRKICDYANTSTSQYAYNQCQYNQAKAQNQFGFDTKYCKAQAKTDYYEYIKSRRCFSDKKYEEANKHADSLWRAQVNETEYTNAAFTQCMFKLGWNSDNSWLDGKHK